MSVDTGGGFCPGKLTLVKFCTVNFLFPSLKMGVKILSLGVWKGKKEIRREALMKFLDYIFSP